ncbi:hypothetical protein AAG565_11235 [Fontimonas sp. SYSU GA230001]|uniref:hypothetical protein n=1 Tax=Fontimonas sp. SYSU GA230001 TaxID=3142450 RepID=UPI0032B4D202
MRRPASAIFMLLLACCLAVQPSAVAGACAHRPPVQSGETAPVHQAHQHHQATGGAVDSGAAAGAATVTDPGCHCGCPCSDGGCFYAAPALPLATAADTLVSRGTGGHAAERVVRRRPAHAIDLLRPPRAA